MTVIGLFTASLSAVSVTIDAHGLTVSLRITRLIIKRIPLETISEVRQEAISPSHWGGWGYRILPGKRGIILHSGPGLVITRLNGRLFAVTVKSPERGVTLLRELMNETR